MSDKVCPSCGHCKECGRGGPLQFRPYVPYVPYYPYQPYWGTITVGSAAGGAGGNLQTGTFQSGGSTITGNSPVSGNLGTLLSK